LPYIQRENRAELEENPLKAKVPGELAYIFARFFYKEWNLNPSWTTYHNFRKVIREPSSNSKYETLISQLSKSIYFRHLDLQIAAELALDEFAWRVIRNYENGKKVANGDVFIDQDKFIEEKTK